MMRKWPCLLCCLLLIFGCGPKQGSQTNERHDTPEQLKGRLDAALSVNNISRRDQALKAIAEDAASAAETELVKQVLEKFNNLSLKDETAVACALKLSAAGQYQSAVEVAKMINNLSKRDEVLQRIAKGE
jgi:hypothetical protein